MATIKAWLEGNEDYFQTTLKQMFSEYGTLTIGKRGDSAIVAAERNPQEFFNCRRSDVEGLNSKEVLALLADSPLTLRRPSGDYTGKNPAIATILVNQH